MQNYKNLILFISIGLLMIGCGGNSPEPLKTGESYVPRYFNVIGNVGKGTDLENTAIALHEAALHFKAKDEKYFKILNTKSNKLHSIITNFESLVNYCYPSTQQSSSLEEKCNLTYFDTDIIRFSFVGYEKPVMNKFVWSVDQVLNDSLLNRYRDSALASFKDKTITFETIKSRKVRKYLYK